MKHQMNILPVLLAACGMYATAQQPTPIAPAPVLPEPAAKPVAPTYSLTTTAPDDGGDEVGDEGGD